MGAPESGPESLSSVQGSLGYAAQKGGDRMTITTHGQTIVVTTEPQLLAACWFFRAKKAGKR